MKKLWMILLLLLTSSLWAKEEKVLNVYNWAEYMPEGVLEQFTKETGIVINYSVYANNEIMYAKLKTLKGEGYDIAVPSNYFVSRMIREGMLTKLDHAKLSHFNNLDPKLLNQAFDPNNHYSIPYSWSSTGIAINTRVIKPGSITQWADLWNPKYKNALLLLDDLREVIGMGLVVLGYPLDDTDETHVQKAYEKLKTLLPNVKMFYADSPKTILLQGEVNIAMIWNGEAYMAKAENPDIEFIYPKEGPLVSLDNLVIPIGAKHIDNAHQFINFLLRPEIAKKVSEELGYSSPNLAAIRLMPKAVAENRISYPSKEDFKNAHWFLSDLGEVLPIYEKYWQKLKVGQ